MVSIANVFNLGADIGAMGAAVQLLLPKTAGIFTVIFGVGSLAGVLLVDLREIFEMAHPFALCVRRRSVLRPRVVAGGSSCDRASAS